MKELTEAHVLRYAKIDFLYWYEFQNKCSEILQAIADYLAGFKPDEDIAEEHQPAFKKNLDAFFLVLTTVFDMLNGDKLTNLSYFALCDDVHRVFELLFTTKVIGVEPHLAKVVELFDYLFILSATSKKHFKFVGPQQFNLNDIIVKFTEQFLSLAGRMNQVTGEEAQERLEQADIQAFKHHGFKSVAGLQYKLGNKFELAARVVSLGLNITLQSQGVSRQELEKFLPPQHTYETLTELLGNPCLDKEVKSHTIELMNRLLLADQIHRFGLQSQRAKNPYYIEATKYCQVYVETF